MLTALSSYLGPRRYSCIDSVRHTDCLPATEQGARAANMNQSLVRDAHV